VQPKARPSGLAASTNEPCWGEHRVGAQIPQHSSLMTGSPQQSAISPPKSTVAAAHDRKAP
jgi:hypothetical protein